MAGLSPAPPAIGVDLGASKIAVALVARDGSVRATREAATPYPAAGGPADLEGAVAQVAALVAELRAAAAPVGIGVAVAGSVDPAARVLRFAPNLNWRGRDVATPLERATGLPVRIDNDANLAALGEARFGRRASSLVCVTLGTGIGGGIVIDGRVLRGRRGWAAEIGHVEAVPGGPPCGCGRAGCLEAVASGTAIGRDWRATGGEGGAREAVAAAAAGDARALSIVSAAARHVGVALADLAWALDPEAVLLSGGMARAGEVLLGPLRQAYRDRAPDGAPPVELARLGEHAGVVGAAALWFAERL